MALAAQRTDKGNDELPLLPAVEPRPLIRPGIDRAPLTRRHQSGVLRCSAEHDRHDTMLTGIIVGTIIALGYAPDRCMARLWPATTN